MIQHEKYELRCHNQSLGVLQINNNLGLTYSGQFSPTELFEPYREFLRESQSISDQDPDDTEWLEWYVRYKQLNFILTGIDSKATITEFILFIDGDEASFVVGSETL